jgi:hypothetical protein
MRAPIFSLILLAGFAVLAGTGTVAAAPSMGPAVVSVAHPSAIESVRFMTAHERRLAELRRREELRHHHH